MTTFLLYDDALRSPEVRHEVAEPILSRVAFIDHDGKRIVVGDDMDGRVLERREDVVDEFWRTFDFGIEDLIRDDSWPQHLVEPEVVLRALQRIGATSVIVPGGFSILVADYLRGKGVDVEVDADAWGIRRRRKAPWELEGVERAQRAAETAMLTASRMLRSAERTSDGQLRFEGEILTAELVRETMIRQLASLGAESQQILIHSGDACLDGHDLGSGPILPDVSCIIDCWPRDARTGVYTDMTRTFVPGVPSDEIRRLHGHCQAALAIALEHLGPGRNDAYKKVVEYFETNGLPTQESHEGADLAREGFPHSLGHGVGLEVHEPPLMGPRFEELVEGDVVAVEPGLYFEGVGGVRLEDTVMISSDGVERFTDPYPYGLEP